MQQTVMQTRTLSACLLACLMLAAGAQQVGANEDEPSQYDWQGTWESSFTFESSCRRFPWEFTRIKDEFSASFYFSVDRAGNVRGKAHGSIFYRFDADGCGTITENPAGGTCTIRCTAKATVEGDKSYKLNTVGPTVPVVFPEVYPRIFPDISRSESAIPVTGQVNAGTVHLKLGPPADLVPFEMSGSCVGPRGTYTTATKMSWFCPAGSQLCAPSAMFLEIDMPLAHGAAQAIHQSGLDGMVRLRRSCRNIRDGESGFVYVSANSTQWHKEPAANSPSLGGAPRGARLVFRDTIQKDGTRWYHVDPPGGNPGWVPSSEVSCERPPPLPPGKKLYLKDTGLGNAHPTAAMTSASAG